MKNTERSLSHLTKIEGENQSRNAELTGSVEEWLLLGSICTYISVSLSVGSKATPCLKRAAY
jgi:hypothetical protein